jgi:hypothetical protein
MAIEERRWRQVWSFLSLEQTLPYFDHLWLSLDEPQEFQSGLRELLRPWVDERKYQEEPGAIHTAAARWFVESRGAKQFELLSRWVRDIYFEGGPDRAAEGLWSALCANSPLAPGTGFDPLPGTPDWLPGLMTKLKEEKRRRAEPLVEKLDEEEGEAASDWDERLLAVQETEPHIITSRISLIGHYNVFLEVWDEHCSALSFEQLRQLWELAALAAPEIGMEDIAIPFPGSWLFELRPFLDR